MMQRHLHFGMDHEVKLRTPLHSHVENCKKDIHHQQY